MNKTININLGGYFFHIDENAYQKLRRYLDAIARSLSDDPQGKNEIISDIETRISELLSEKITDARQVVNEQDISDIIAIMGEPEDYAESEEGYTDSSYSNYSRKQSNSKKLFRDGDDKFLGGVASGIAHYFDVDVIWIRLAFLLLLFGGGFSLILYIVLWILLPEAKTTAEKLQMEGEPVNIDNIEKKIREEFSAMSEKIKDGANEVTQKVNERLKKNGSRTKSGFQEFLDTLGKIIVAIFNIIGKFIGVIIIIVSAIVLISFILALFSIGSFELIGLSDEFVRIPPFLYDSVLPKWLLATCGLILVGFPFLILFVLGLRILSSNIRKFSKTTTLTLTGIWIVALLVLVFKGIEFTSHKAAYGSKTIKKDLLISDSDTLNIKMIDNEELYEESSYIRSNNRREILIGDKRKLYSNYVRVDVRKSKTEKAYVKIRKSSQGRNISKARESAEVIEYKYTLEGNDIILNNYFLSEYKNIIKGEKVEIILYIPKGASVYFDPSSEKYLNNVENTEDIADEDMVKHHFIITDEGLDCTDCKEYEALKDLGIKKSDSIK